MEKLGWRDRRISPDSGSLFQTFPRVVRVDLGNSEIQAWALKLGLLKETKNSIATDSMELVLKRTIVDVEAGIRSSTVKTLKLRNLLSPETLSSAIAALWPAHGFITTGTLGFSEVGGVVASLLACLLSAKKGLYQTIGSLESAAIFLSIRDSQTKPMPISELFSKTCEKLKSVDVISFSRADFDRNIQVLLNEELIYESGLLWRIAENVVIKE